MKNVSKSSPISPVLHEGYSFAAAGCRGHWGRGFARVNGRSTINQLFKCLTTTNPYEQSGAGRRAKYLSVLFCPFLYVGDRIVLGLDQSLVDERPAADVGREMAKAWIASPVLAEPQNKKERNNHFGVTDRGIHAHLTGFKATFKQGYKRGRRTLVCGPHELIRI
jgi:hypothetical protein